MSLYHRLFDTGDRHPTSILRFPNPSGKARRHPTQKPLGLMDWLVRSYTLPGQTVLDPFMGSGVTVEAAVAAGRHAIGIERDDAFFEATRDRLSPSPK